MIILLARSCCVSHTFLACSFEFNELDLGLRADFFKPGGPSFQQNKHGCGVLCLGVHNEGKECSLQKITFSCLKGQMVSNSSKGEGDRDG